MSTVYDGRVIPDIKIVWFGVFFKNVKIIQDQTVHAPQQISVVQQRQIPQPTLGMAGRLSTGFWTRQETGFPPRKHLVVANDLDRSPK